MITYATYYDHIERGGYNPALVVSSWKSCDSRVICCASGQVDVLKRLNLDAEIIDIGLGISVPSDIPKAINKSLDTCFDRGTDWLVFIHGDLYMTEYGDRFIYNGIKDGHSASGTIPVMGVSLYSIMYVHNSLLTINSRDSRARHNPDADGDEMLVQPDAWTQDLSLLLDIGYMGLEQYYTKTRNHVHIWPEDFKRNWLRMYERGDKAGCVRATYKAMRVWRCAPLVPINLDIYRDLLEKMNLMDDYAFCTSLMPQV